MVEQFFAIHYGKVKAMFGASGITGELRNELLAEAANTSTLLGNIISNGGDKPPHVNFYGDLPRHSRGLRFFGELGIVHRGKKLEAN